MRNLNELDQYREPNPYWAQTQSHGYFKVMAGGRSFYVGVSIDITEDGLWEHISVVPKNKNRTPTWDEMCAIKDIFFKPEEECIQFHPKKSRYINFVENCLHIWKPVDERLLKTPGWDMDRIDTLEIRDAKLEKLWAELSDLPMDPDTECIDEPFLHFEAGTHRNDIWEWFDERHSKGVAYLLYRDGVDRTDEMSKLCYQKQLCVDCDSQFCAFNPHGVCMLPFVTGRAPKLNEDGCEDYIYNEKEN